MFYMECLKIKVLFNAFENSIPNFFRVVPFIIIYICIYTYIHISIDAWLLVRWDSVKLFVLQSKYQNVMKFITKRNVLP
jgi:uncharacterized membrane protein YraQ (UPF0718 family)